MAKVRFQGEWKMWIGVAVIVITLVGYLYFVSRPPMEGGEYLWQVQKILGPKQVMLRGSGQTVELTLQALDVPDSEAQAARDLLDRNLMENWVRIKASAEDGKSAKTGFLFLSGEDIHARMIRQGLATIDRRETSFDVRPYIELEMEAKREKRGLWGKPDAGAK